MNITCNKNTIPYDELKPAVTSGIRLGTPAVTSRGLKEEDMVIVANLIDCALRNKDSIENIKKEVVSLMDRFPIYQ